MMDLSQARWRKTTDVDREHPIFELICEEKILLDIGISNDGIDQIAFHEGILNAVIDSKTFNEVIANGQEIARGK